MSSYNFDFRSITVGFNRSGIHALRSDVIKKTIAWEDVKFIRIKRGMDYNNWLIMIILGGAMVITGLVLICMGFGNLTQDAEWLLSFLELNSYSITLMGLGLLVFILGLRRNTVIEIQTNKNWHRFSLREIDKRDQLRGLVFYIQNQLPLTANLTIMATP